MNCYECAKAGVAEPAVAICPHCYAGLCISHLDLDVADPGRGGMYLGCSHDTRAPRGMSHATA